MPIRRFSFWLLLSSCFWALSVAQANPETLSRSVYKGSFSGWKVEMVRTLTHTGNDQYVLRSEAKNLFASVVETSEFSLQRPQLIPTSYVYTRSVFGRQANEKIQFDWQANTAFYSRSDRPQNNMQHTLVTGLLDPALYQIALQADLANGKENLQYTFIKRKRQETYEFQLLPNEQFSLQKKNYDALVLLRKDTDNNKTTRIWVLPELDYQVAKIHHTDDGDTYEITLAAYQGDSVRLKQFYNSLLPELTE
jgi:hypothetical protein